jgi:hypothetical protein
LEFSNDTQKKRDLTTQNCQKESWTYKDAMSSAISRADL